MNKIYDLVVIGGGASGIMAAIAASYRGIRVLIIEKNEIIGKKILISGKGRCNITTADTDVNAFIKKCGNNGKFLYSSLSQFSILETIDFFNNVLKIETKIERGNRIFPVSDSAKVVNDVFLERLQSLGVDIKFETKVEGFDFDKKTKQIKAVLTNNGKFLGRNFLITTGGKSYPKTGSSGDGYLWLAKLGHKVHKPYPALTPLICRENFVQKLEGLSLKNVEISVDKISLFGEALFTKNGLSGPIILDISSEITDKVSPSNFQILNIDFKPALSFDQLDKRILRDFEELKIKKFKNSLNKLLPQKLIPIIIDLSKIDPDKPCNLIKKEERQFLVQLLKNFQLTVVDVLGFNKAIVTKGGLSLKEVDPKSMRSKLVENLYIAGEILDLNAPTGGYNLQIAWSTGYVAGMNVE